MESTHRLTEACTRSILCRPRVETVQVESSLRSVPITPHARVNQLTARRNRATTRMATTEYPLRYEDPEYQKSHRAVYSHSLLAPLQQVLPPGLSQQDFETAVNELVEAVGKESVFIGKALEEYVDPYELWEVEGKCFLLQM